MKIAIVGAGFSGLACAWYLLANSHNVAIFDSKGIGAGASGIAAGLMHPFSSQTGTLSWQAREALSETLKLIDVASKALGVPVAQCTGMLRPAITEKQKLHFPKTAATHADTQWWPGAIVKREIPQLLDLDSLFISSAVTVDSRLYLQGLWKACSQKGAWLEIAHITHSVQLKDFDAIVFAVGAGWKSLQDVTVPDLTLIKGQILELAWPQGIPPLLFPINGSGYLAMTSKERCIAGATFERVWQNEKPDLRSSEAPIRKSIAQFSPLFAAASLIDCHAAVRAATQNKLPHICKSGPNHWCLSGMGSKGLLYHALMAKQLCFSMALLHK